MLTLDSDANQNPQAIVGGVWDGSTVTRIEHVRLLDTANGQMTVTGSEAANSLIGGDNEDHLFGGGGNDVLVGGNGGDSLLGGDGDDQLFGLDSIGGVDGSDHIDGGAGNDYILAAAGNDTIRGGANDDTVNGQGGNDTVFGDAGNDTLIGDAGWDTLDGGLGADTIFGGTGNDTVTHDAADALILGGDGLDTLRVADLGDVADVIRLNEARFNGGDLTFANGQFELVELGGGSDVLVGDWRDDVVLNALDTSLTVFAGDGNDRVSLWGLGNDTVYGGNGEDRIWASLGDDLLYGGGDASRDIFYGGAGNDTMFGGAGDDYYFVGWGDGDDVIDDALGSNTLHFFYGFNTKNWLTAPGSLFYGVHPEDVSFTYGATQVTVTIDDASGEPPAGAGAANAASVTFDNGDITTIFLSFHDPSPTVVNPPFIYEYQWDGDSFDLV